MAIRLTLRADRLARALAATSFAISTEEQRYYLNGTYVHQVAGEAGPSLRFVATDGHRLARFDEPEAAGLDENVVWPGIIVPRKAIGEIARACDAAKGGEAEIEIGTTRISVRVGGLTLRSKLIDGTFPDYARVIPTANEHRLTVEVAAFAAAVDRVAAITTEQGRAVRMELDDGRLTLSAASPDSGTATEEMDADYDGDRFAIGFNARYMLDILGAMASDTALIKLADPGSPMLITPREGAFALYVLMPMRV